MLTLRQALALPCFAKARFVAGEPGAQFTPAGVLKFSLPSAQPEDVLARLQSLVLAGVAR